MSRLDDLYAQVIEFFQRERPVAESELVYGNAYELLVAVILSAQCTDKRVNSITPALFERYPTSAAMAQATSDEVFEYIRSCSYPNNKAKHLVGMAQVLERDFGGEVPSSVDELMRLPGVGRKTANVIASVIFDQPAMAVDTHVFRVAHRIGLVDSRAKTPLAVEQQLVQHIAQELIPKAHHWLILHGRYVCIARKPRCSACGLTHCCKAYKTLEPSRRQ